MPDVADRGFEVDDGGRCFAVVGSVGGLVFPAARARSYDDVSGS